MPLDHIAARLFVGLVVTGVIHHQLGPVLLPILDGRKAEVLVEIPAHLHFRAKDQRGRTIPGTDLLPFLVRGHVVASFHKLQIDAAVVRVVLPPLLAELAKGEHLRIGILRPNRFQPVGQVIRIQPRKQGQLPNCGQKTVTILRDSLVIEVDIARMEDFPEPQVISVIGLGLNGANSHPVVAVFTHATQACRKEVHGPSIDIHHIHEVIAAPGLLSRFQKMLFGWIIGIDDATVAVLPINIELAPNLSLDGVNTLVFRQVFHAFH